MLYDNFDLTTIKQQNDNSLRKTANMSQERERDIFMAQVLIHTDRIKDSIKYLKKAIDINPALTIEERSVFNSAYKTLVSIPRKGLREIMLSEQNNEEENFSQECKSQIQIIKNEVTEELIGYCMDLINILDAKIIPATEEVESKVFYYKLKGDYYRYICEVQSDDDRDETVEKARECYETALSISKNQLEQYKPTALGLILNYTVFLFEIVKRYDDAISLAEETYKMCVPILEQNSARSKAEATTIATLLDNNVKLWKATLKHNAENEN